MGYSQIIQFNRIFHLQTIHFGDAHFKTPPDVAAQKLPRRKRLMVSDSTCAKKAWDSG